MKYQCQSCGRVYRGKVAHNCDGGKQWKEVTDPAITCQSCKHMRERTKKDIKVEGGHDLDRHWCAANDMPTTPGAFRCGGDDYEPKVEPHHEPAD